METADNLPPEFGGRLLLESQRLPFDGNMILHLALLFTLSTAPPIFLKTADPLAPPVSVEMRAVLNHDSLDAVVSQRTFLYALYQRFLSPIDGHRCPMRPSCSKYSREAIQEYGFFKGLLLTMDRLLRCGSDLHLYQEIREEGVPRFLDPLPNQRSEEEYLVRRCQP